MAIEVTSIEEKRPAKVRRVRLKDARRALKIITATRRRRIILRSILGSILLLIIAGTIFFIYSYKYYAAIVDERLKNGFLTSRAGIYAAPRVLRAGQTLSPESLVEHLRRAGYIENNASDAWSGSFTLKEDGSIEIRPSRTRNTTPTVVQVRFDKKGRIAELTGDLGVT